MEAEYLQGAAVTRRHRAQNSLHARDDLGYRVGLEDKIIHAQLETAQQLLLTASLRYCQQPRPPARLDPDQLLQKLGRPVPRQIPVQNQQIRAVALNGRKSLPAGIQ